MLAKMILQAAVAAAVIAGAAAVYAAVPPPAAEAAPQPSAPPQRDTGYLDPADRPATKSFRERDKHERDEHRDRFRRVGEDRRQGRRDDDD